MTDQPRTLDWRSHHDPRSLDYPVREVINRVVGAGSAVVPTKKIWPIGDALPLDQGREGACVGFGWSGELASSPVRVRGIDNAYAHDLYKLAQTLDDWPGENYEGTSVLAGAKACVQRGHIGSYRWAFSTDDIRDAILTLGPVVIGIPWYENMYQTKPSGLVVPGGQLVGGHCIMVNGYNPRARIPGEGWLKRYEVFYWTNSWGRDYGQNGRGIIKAEDLAALLKDTGEACVPLTRM